MEATGQSGSRSADDEYELPFLLDSDELERLPQTLVAVGAAEDIQDAQNAIHRIPTRNATDILCSLWYLVPYTRGQITASLQDEYCRLGMSSEAIRALASLTDSVNSVARTAYEFVAVCSNLNIGVPLEVLVHGLRVSYSEWLTMCVEGNPIWGLLYDDLSSDDSVIYSTRNEVVTRVLVDLVNGGLGHTGEYNRLKTLVSACQIGTPVYRTFLHELLVKSRAKLNGILSFEQGLELYEMAETSFPEKDRSIAHHHGIWIADAGKDPLRAYRQFERALVTPDYPFASGNEPKEIVHTSMAAAVVANARMSNDSSDSALAQIREHLRQAENSLFFPPPQRPRIRVSAFAVCPRTIRER